MTYYYDEPCPYAGEQDDDGYYAWTWGENWEKLDMYVISSKVYR